MYYKFLSILVLNSSDNYYIGYYSEHDFNIRRCSSRLTVTKRMSLVEQELFIIPERMTSLSGFSGVRVAQFVVFCVVFCRSLFLFLSLFFCPLYCMSFELWFLNSSLVSSLNRRLFNKFGIIFILTSKSTFL